MTKVFAMVVSLALIVTVSVSPVWAAGDKVRSDNAAGPAGTDGGGDPQASRGTPVGESVQILSVQQGVKGKNGKFQGTLTEKEIDDILFIREEEKLARDVYRTLFYQYPEATIFETISQSEQRHMDAMKSLIDNYELEDPVMDDDIGEFTNPDFTVLYAELVEKGEMSYCNALQVGIDIEILDIEDIELALNDVKAQDVNRVLTNLLNGSYNHLNAFNNQYALAGCQ